jgi:hypothetical protein
MSGLAAHPRITKYGRIAWFSVRERRFSTWFRQTMHGNRQRKHFNPPSRYRNEPEVQVEKGSVRGQEACTVKWSRAS